MAFTPTQQRIYDFLSDGAWHSKLELMPLLDDEQAGPTALPFHISKMRERLSQAGEDIVARDGGYYLSRRVNMYNE